MERTLYHELTEWKNRPSRLPLIVRGARQVGKSFLIEQLGKREFEQLHVINFEKQPQLATCFNSLDPKNIPKELELQAGIQVKTGTSLLFFDEIQDCPQALKALRYFAEEMPEQHVIAAGSLLEFILEDKAFSFPVGRVEIMNLGPLTFSEYLLAQGEQALNELLQTGSEISEAVHKRLLEFVREFFCIGGMPGIVANFVKQQSFLEARRQQSAILDLYALDFGKYATRYAEHRHLKKLFEMAPNLIGKHFKYSKIDPNCANPARDFREALIRLQQARLILPVHQTRGNGLPLRAEKNEKKFKIFLLDIGLLSSALGWESLHMKESVALFRGVAAEQFVAQQLCTLQDPFIEKGLYYWENSERSSSAEIDFLINLKERMLPIEVKSGPTGRLKSLRQFMKDKGVNIGLKISESPLDFKDGILSVPFYLIGEINRLVETIALKEPTARHD